MGKRIPIAGYNGYEKDFNQRKFPAGSFGTTRDTKRAFVAYSDGETKDLAIKDDIEDLQSQIDSVSTKQTNDAADLKVALELAQASIHHIAKSDDGTELYSYNYDGEEVDVITGFSGGGGSGGGGGGGGGDVTPSTTTEMTMANAGTALNTKLAPGTPYCPAFTWSSTIDSVATGDGNVNVYVSGSLKYSSTCAQGTVTLPDLSRFLSNGRNTVRVVVIDAYDNSRERRYTAELVDISNTAPTFSVSAPFSGSFVFPCVPNGNVDKIIHTSIDGTELETVATAVSGSRVNIQIPAQAHGQHTLECWFIADIDGTMVESNRLHYEFASIASGNTTPVIWSQYEAGDVNQYANIAIDYYVYDPSNPNASIQLLANDEVVNDITVDRALQTWAYRVRGTEDITLKIKCKTEVKPFALHVIAAEVPIEAATDDLELYLTANGRSNGEANPASWTFGNISASFSGFNWVTDGWLLDEDQNSMLSVRAGCTVNIPYQIFAQDCRNTGLTIEVDMATTDIRNYDTPVLTCWSGDSNNANYRGIRITAQEIRFASAQETTSMPFKEDEHTRVGITVSKKTDGCLIMTYIDGEFCAPVQYPAEDDDFQQMNPVGISIGSPDCTVNIYGIRVYRRELTRKEMLMNYIADQQDADVMLALYDHNNIFDANGNVSMSMLPKDLAYEIVDYSGTHMPQYKGDKVTVSTKYVEPLYPARCYETEGTQIDVQGTSSQGYPRKNYKEKHKGTIILNGKTVTGVELTPGDMPVAEFCDKKDFASSDKCNNTKLSELYDDLCPYKTPAQQKNPLVRTTIKGVPMVMFKTANGTDYEFIGAYNKNFDKGTEKLFGFASPDQSIEIKNNTDDLALFKSADFDSIGADGTPLYLGTFEWRYPEDLNDPAVMKEFWGWVVSCDPEKATGNALDAAVTYGDVTYTNDTAEYRVAKFKAQAGDYFESQAVLFYYVFTTTFLLADNRAKNMFPSFVGGDVA